MPGYYVYIMSNDGHVQNRINVICADDEEARNRARRLMDGQAVELWPEGRKIAEFKPEN